MAATPPMSPAFRAPAAPEEEAAEVEEVVELAEPAGAVVGVAVVAALEWLSVPEMVGTGTGGGATELLECVLVLYA
jgi:hypothetical protein